MSSEADRNNPRDPYLSVNAESQALGALERAGENLELVLDNPEMWKWALVALHDAVQNFMVLALTGSTNWGALRDEDISAKVQAEFAYRNALASQDEVAAARANQEMLFGETKLASFPTLYNRIKSTEWWMKRFVSSQSFEPRPTDDLCIRDLDSVRNEFMHFVPMSRGFLLTQFPAMTESALYLINFLVQDSRNIQWFDDSHPQRYIQALSRASRALAAIQQAYADLPLPARGLCGSPDE